MKQTWWKRERGGTGIQKSNALDEQSLKHRGSDHEEPRSARGGGGGCVRVRVTTIKGRSSGHSGRCRSQYQGYWIDNIYRLTKRPRDRPSRPQQEGREGMDTDGRTMGATGPGTLALKHFFFLQLDSGGFFMISQESGGYELEGGTGRLRQRK